MKTQSEIESLLAPLYGDATEFLFTFSKKQLEEERARLLRAPFCEGLLEAIHGCSHLLQVKQAARPTVRINLSKRPVHA